ncbi:MULTISPECIES: 23S rRNA (guanosine(2251)-2'-O)-methyltransferase RlmB [unclassified Prochlorococcus]|uniref:23S rRNA (guanosine(2251)-2'-O)-methyltransferase RlmB n=1 Tax=unclassified Prochlorococcus TaxID=2627481 RepID=UPI0005337BE7|nr:MULTISPECIES: 23S rRNA (guanosine(2251)-2'-O)-methyltransferase RlmB [unclassified Prochlorococcus]KGG15061.1 23S rRNA (guanosine-2'-O-) -methyltransferase rlmB LSU rRNA Gm2251 [Prochlorococcus sp. MIT 0602]KGG17333.1 23S rRNA (guanosine-2'-O-) -methyltransferase rlmB LSU rRNA Gm2251 [Prochlorococcus sp. MIT 0603]
MSTNDRRGRNSSRNSSSEEGRRKGRKASGLRWQKENKTGWQSRRAPNKSSVKTETRYSENFDEKNQQKNFLRDRNDSQGLKRSSFKSNRAWSSQNEFSRSTSDAGKKQYDSSNRRRSSSFSRNNQKPFIETDQWQEKSNEKIVFESESNDIFWGRHSTQSILESGRPVHRIWCTSEIRSTPRFLQLLKDAKALGVLVEEVSWGRLGHVTNGGVHQGIALQTAASETFDLKTLIEACQDIEESAVLLALDGITDPHNVGAIVRSAEALGAHGMILPQRRSAGLTGSVAKVAAGALEHLPVARVVNLNRSLEELKNCGYTVIGLAEDGDKTVNEISCVGPLVLVIGSEGKGLSLLTRRHCDFLLRIPLRGVTSSLNASVATSISLYELARQGWMKDLSGQAPSPKMVKAKLTTKPFKEK